jgi:hypothetical protein
MRLRHLAAACAAFFVLAAPAIAADPVPGALYEGTTEDGNPFQFRVSPDGAAVTDLLSAISITCVGSQGGVEVKALAQQTPFTVSEGTITGTDAAVTPRLEMHGTFTSPGEATGMLLVSFAKMDYSGGGLTTCLREFTWNARAAAAPTPTPDPGGGGGGGGESGGSGGGGEVGSGPAPAPALPSVAPPAPRTSKRARAIKRCKRMTKRAKRARCLRRARRIRN